CISEVLPTPESPRIITLSNVFFLDDIYFLNSKMIGYYMQKVAETNLFQKKLGGMDDFLRCLLDKNADGVGCNV
ncbi:hypothetical protein PP707_08555, partial [Acetobacter pasteurianus]|nr:hypothetical protein [Acetobacter pasteurianus]